MAKASKQPEARSEPVKILPEERETCINMNGGDHASWEVFSDDPYWIRRLDKIATGTPKGFGFVYQLTADQVLVRKGKRKVERTPEQAAAMKLRAQLMRQKS